MILIISQIPILPAISMIDAVNIYKDITAADIEKRLASIMNEEYSALSVVKRVEK